MKILVLHGLFGNSLFKAAFLKRLGHEVCVPKLTNWSLKRAFRQAKQAHDEFQPDVIVGSSRGGAIAMLMQTSARRILMAPAWRRFNVGVAGCSDTVVIHGRRDTLIPFGDSFELNATVVVVDDSHRLLGLKGLRALRDAIQAPVTQMAE